MPGTVHVVFAIAALILGAVVAFRPKGGRGHRILGYCYALFLLTVNVSALSVYEETVGMGSFHILAIISLATLISGFIPAFLRRPVSSWLALHAYFISWSYVGLVAAGNPERLDCWSPASPSPDVCVEAGGSPKFPWKPHASLPCSLTPAGTTG